MSLKTFVNSSGSVRKNENYIEDIQYATDLNRRIANIVGIWPRKADFSRLKWILKDIQKIICYCFFGYIIIPGFMHAILERHGGKVIKTLLSTILNTSAVIKYTVIIFREKKIRSFIDLIEQDWKSVDDEEHRHIMRKNADIGRKLTRLSCYNFYCAGLSLRLFKTLLAPSIVGLAGTIRPLPTPIYRIAPFNASASPVYEVVFAMQILSGFIAHSTTITTCGLAAVLGTHACGQFDIVMSHISRLTQDHNGKNSIDESVVKDKFRNIVGLHIKTLRFVQNVEDLMHDICLIEVFGGTLMLGLSGFYFITEIGIIGAFDVFTYSVILTSLLGLVFTYCYIGELVSDKAKKIGASSYMVDWYRLPGKHALGVAMIIAISRSPVHLSAGKLLDLSMYNFGSIMRAAVSSLNLLRRVVE